MLEELHYPAEQFARHGGFDSVELSKEYGETFVQRECRLVGEEQFCGYVYLLVERRVEI